MPILPTLEAKHARNFHILYSAQTQANVPSMFDADEHGNLQRVGKFKTFWINVWDVIWSHGTQIRGMNDRVRSAVTLTLRAIDAHFSLILAQCTQQNLPNQEFVNEMHSKVNIVIPRRRYVFVQAVRRESLLQLNLDRISLLYQERFSLGTPIAPIFKWNSPIQGAHAAIRASDLYTVLSRMPATT